MSFSRTGAELGKYYLFVWSHLNFLHISKWITLPTQSCLALYSFYANLLHSLIMCLIVSSLSPHRVYLLFCCVLSIYYYYYYHYYYYYYYYYYLTALRDFHTALADDFSMEFE